MAQVPERNQQWKPESNLHVQAPSSCPTLPSLMLTGTQNDRVQRSLNGFMSEQILRAISGLWEPQQHLPGCQAVLSQSAPKSMVAELSVLRINYCSFRFNYQMACSRRLIFLHVSTSVLGPSRTLSVSAQWPPSAGGGKLLVGSGGG